MQTTHSMPAWSRPIRVPESIDLTHADPPFAAAGEISTWRLGFRLSKDVPSGSLLMFQLCGGRNNKPAFWNPQIENPGDEGYLSSELDDGRDISMRATEKPGTYVLCPPEDVKKGQKLVIVLGDRAQGGPGIKVGRNRMLNKFFILYGVPNEAGGPQTPQWAGGSVWAKGTEALIVAACTMHVLGGPKDHIRAYVPATAVPKEPFNVLVRPEDEFSNLSHQKMSDIVISVDGKPLDAQIDKVPDSTCLRARVSLSTAGVHRLEVRETDSGYETMSNPVICSGSTQSSYWGMIHGHTELSDGTGKIDQYFHQLKNEVMLDFGAQGDHDHLWETPDELWEVTCDAVKRWHTPGEFVSFLGYEWAKWRQNGDGDRNVYYLDDDRPLYRSDDEEYPSPPDLFEVLRKNKERAIVIPHHTGHGGNFCDWKDHSPEHERLVEIFQLRGSYECSEEDGNPVPEKVSDIPAYTDGYVRNALALGWRVGFTAGGDDHGGHWGTEFRFGWRETDYKQGLMCVEARGRTREDIFEAMYNRRVVATTGSRMLLTYNINGNPMGSELTLTDIPELAAARRLSVEFHGMAPVARIDIIRNNTVVHSVSGHDEMDLSITWEDTAPIDDTWLPEAPFCAHPFTFYYVRVLQVDGEVAWASPVWIDP